MKISHAVFVKLTNYPSFCCLNSFSHPSMLLQKQILNGNRVVWHLKYTAMQLA